VLKPPAERIRKSRSRSATSFKSVVNNPRTDISKSSRATPFRIPQRSSHEAIVRASHSAARLAVHGASTGTCLAIQSSFTCAQAMVATASGLIIGMRPR